MDLLTTRQAEAAARKAAEGLGAEVASLLKEKAALTARCSALELRTQEQPETVAALALETSCSQVRASQVRAS